MSDAKAIEQFVLAHNGGVLLPISVPKVCELLSEWNRLMTSESPFVPSEFRCPSCNYRAGVVQACPIDGSSMQPVTWREAALTASRIASRARKRCEVLIEGWPVDRAIPVGEEDENPSIEEKIERLQEKGLRRITFAHGRVGLQFGYDESAVESNYYPVVYYDSIDEAISAEYLKRQP